MCAFSGADIADKKDSSSAVNVGTTLVVVCVRLRFVMLVRLPAHRQPEHRQMQVVSI